jgi:hypothetical protein
MLCEDGNDSKLAWPDSSAKIESDWYVEIEIPQYANAPKTRAPNKDPSVVKNFNKGSTTVPGPNPTTVDGRISRIF